MKRLGCLLALAGLLAGCDGPAATDPRMRLAEKCRAEGDFPAAERQILRYLNAHPDSADAHLRLASLYDESLHDPVGAAFHYREYLRLVPDSPQRKEIEAWMLAARKRCAPERAAEAPAPPPVSAAEYDRLTRENEALKTETERQRRELAELRRPAAPPSAAPPASGEAPREPAATEFVEYEVRSGDSLGKIARRFYGSSRKIEPIMKANGLTPESILHIGRKLKIPPKTR